MFIYSYQQHDHLLPGNDRMLVIGSSALAKNHGHLKSSRLAADTLIFNFPLNHPRLWRQMEHSLSGARYSIILFMWPPLHLSPANGRLMEKPPEGGGPTESAEDMLCRLFAFLRKQTRRLILLSSPPSDYGSARHPYAEEPGVLEAWNALLRTLAGKLNLPFIDFCGDMLQYRPLPGSGEEDFPEAYRNLGKQVLHRLPFGQTWVRRRSGKIHRLLEKRRKRRKERMLARWRTLTAPPHYREETDWITAIHSEKGQARILLIGGSVNRHPFSGLNGASMLFPSPAYSFPQPLLQDPSHEIPRCHDNPARSRIPGEITHPRHVFRHRRLGPAPGRSHSHPLPSRQFRTLL